jgi:hypothetical protein
LVEQNKYIFNTVTNILGLNYIVAPAVSKLLGELGAHVAATIKSSVLNESGEFTSMRS